jgi:hypothetical protein
MIGYIDPEIIFIPNPVGIDKAIQGLQTKLATLPWLQKVFGRSFEGRETVPGARDRIFPYVYQNDLEPLNVMPNDNLRSQVFFRVDDPAVFAAWTFYSDTQTAVYPISIIFWGDLRKIDTERNYNFGEELKLSALRLMTRISGFVVSRVYEQYDEVFREYTLSDTYKQYLLPPYYGFRIEGSFSVDMLPENC